MFPRPALVCCILLGFVAVFSLFIPFSFSAEFPQRITSYSSAQKPGEQVAMRFLNAFPHDKSAFTQGLLWNDGVLYESTGQYGQSTLRRCVPQTGNVTARVSVPAQFFAEGIALVEQSLFLLTWRENRCFVFDKQALQFYGEFSYPGEGWGLTFDGESLILSDGTSVLRFFNPKTFKQKRKIDVKDFPKNHMAIPIRQLNELEWIRGEIWANVWQTTKIVRINPQNGNVLGWFDLQPFVPLEHRNDSQNCVLNGIAWDPKTNHVYITGKYWNVMYQFLIERNP